MPRILHRIPNLIERFLVHVASSTVLRAALMRCESPTPPSTAIT
jgi:hypothetical protein